MAKTKPKRSWKKNLLAGGSLAAFLLILVALILPFVIDLNRFKPQVKAVVSEAVNAEIEFESIRLTILTGLGVRLTNVTLTNTDPIFKGTRFFHVDDMVLRVDLMPLLEKRFEGYLSIDGPEVAVVSKGVRNNLAALTKPSEPSEPRPEAEPSSEEETAKREEMVEKFKGNVVVRSVRIDNARFVLRQLDKSNEEPVRVNDLDIDIKNIGLEQNIETLISTDVDVSQGAINLSGPIRLTLDTKVSTKGTKFEVATFSGTVDLDQFAINAMNAFVKKPGVALNVKFSGAARSNSFSLSEMVLNLHNLAINAKASVNDFAALNTQAEVHVENKDLSGLGEVLPQHADLLVKSSIDLTAKVNGLLSDLAQLAADIELQSELTGSDLGLKVEISNAQAPALSLNVDSRRLDLGAILGPFMSPQSGEPSPKQDKAPKDTPPPEDYSLSPELKALLASADIRANMELDQILYEDLEVNQFLLSALLKNLQAELNPLSLSIFQGNIKMKGKVDLDATPIAFSGDVNMQGVEVQEIIALLAEEHKELLQGRANIELQVNGQGTTIPTLSDNLNGEGKFAFLDGQLNSGSVAAKMGDELDSFIASSSISKAASGAFANAEKLLDNPVLQKAGAAKKFNIDAIKAKFDAGTKVEIANKLDTEKSLKDTTGEFEIKDGKFHITSAKASDSGTMKLNATVALDGSLGGQAVFNGSSQLKEDMKKQSKYASLFFDKSGNLSVPLKLSGQASDPKVAVDTASLKSNFERNANQVVKDELTSEIEKLKTDLIGGQVEKAKAELAKKKAELKAQADAKKAELAAKQKQMEMEAKKKLEEEKKKKEAEAKAKAKDKLKGFIP
jgi:uncharacterized protein involved in outer membrane biogenesis